MEQKSRKQARFERRLQRRKDEKKQERAHFLYPRMTKEFCKEHEEEIAVILKRLQEDFPQTFPKEGRRALRTGIFRDLDEWRYETSLGFPISEELLSAALSTWCDGADYFRALETGLRYDLTGHATEDPVAKNYGRIRLRALAIGSFQQEWVRGKKTDRVTQKEAIAIIQELQEDYPTLFPKKPAPKKALHRGIEEELLPWCKIHHIERPALQQALRYWCCGVRYAKALAEGVRYGLTGEPIADQDAARCGLAKLQHYEAKKGNA